MDLDLSTLSPEELLELKAKLDLAIQGKRKPTDLKDHGLSLTLAVMLPFFDPIKFARAYGRSKYIERANYLAALVDRAGPGAERNVKTAMREIIMQCLARWLESIAVPITATTLMNNIERAEYATDQDYPHYVRNGKLPIVLTLARR